MGRGFGPVPAFFNARSTTIVMDALQRALFMLQHGRCNEAMLADRSMDRMTLSSARIATDQAVHFGMANGKTACRQPIVARDAGLGVVNCGECVEALQALSAVGIELLRQATRPIARTSGPSSADRAMPSMGSLRSFADPFGSSPVTSN